MREQALPEVSEVPVGVARRRDALVHLDDVRLLPGHRLVGQGAQHLPRRVTAADGDDEPAPGGHGRPSFGRDEHGRRASHRASVGQYLDLHAGFSPVTIGSCPPPGGVGPRSTSFGPHVPGPCADIGGLAFTMGATIRQASSTWSSRANSVASPCMASPRTRSYASISSARGWRVPTISASVLTVSSPGAMTLAPIAMVTSGLMRSRQ